MVEATKILNNLIQSNTPRQQIEDFIIKLYYICDGTKDHIYSTNVAKSLKSMNQQQFAKALQEMSKGLSLICAGFQSPNVNQLKEAAKFLKIELEEKLFLPIYNCYTAHPVYWGYMYVQKLEHMSEIKKHSRNVGPYISTTLEPTRGKAKAGGQRFGEMDSWSLFAYDCKSTIKDLFELQSDNPDIKKFALSQIQQTGSVTMNDLAPMMDDDMVGGSRNMTNSVFIGMGIDPSKG